MGAWLGRQPRGGGGAEEGLGGPGAAAAATGRLLRVAGRNNRAKERNYGILHELPE